VGANGSGKSTFLRALQFFYESGAAYNEEDFYNRATSDAIEISLTFSDLSATEQEFFKRYLQGNNLTVVKVMSWPIAKGSQRYHGIRLRHDGFSQVRASSTAKEQKQVYESLRVKAEYSGLTPWTNHDDAMASLEAWESAHLDQCKPMRDEGQFFGFKQVGEARLERYSRFVLIPAVEDASDQGCEGKATALTQLMDLVVRDALRKREELVRLQSDFAAKSNEIFDKAKHEELQRLQNDLTASVTELGSDAEVQLEWTGDSEMEIPLPRASVRLKEDGYPAPVGSTGHGLQRLFIMALLQRLGAASSPVIEIKGNETPAPKTTQSPQATPSVILVIEEPELYQHPNRQRSMSRIFRQLSQAGIPGVASRVQIICTTHSPVFLDIEYFDQIRVTRKLERSLGKPKETAVSQASLEEITREMEHVWGRKQGSFSIDATREKLRILMTSEVNEGFLADVAILVEGAMDKAALYGYAASKDVSLEKLGVTVIQCSGKPNLARPATIFRKLGIPTYVVWDNDEDKKDDPKRSHPEENRRLLRLHRATEDDFPVVAGKNYAAIKVNMETAIKEEVGTDLYGKALMTVSATFDNVDAEVLKANPLFVEQFFRLAAKEGRDSSTLASILGHVRKLKGKVQD